MAEELSKQYARCVEPALALLALTFEAVFEEVIYPQYEISICETQDLGTDATGKKILGAFDPIENVAFIDPILGPTSKDPRRVFTLWHEVAGHGVLQGDWLRLEMARVRASGLYESTDASLSFANENLLERQANVFAARAAAPDWFLLHVIDDTFNLTRPIRYIGRARYTFSVRGHFVHRQIDSLDDLCRFIASCIQYRFGWLSIESLSYRIRELKSVIENLSKPPFVLHRAASARTHRPSTCESMRLGNYLAVS